MRRLRSLRLLYALVLWAAMLPAMAGALPAAVDGQALPSLAPMLEGVLPSVVNVHTRNRVRLRDPFLEDPVFRYFFGLPDVPRERIQQSLGSGVIVDGERGLVLTNHHVIAGAEDILVTLQDGRTLPARFVGSDPETDLALIRVAAENLKELPLADSDRLRVGDFVVAVGNPFGLGQTVTSGIVSALGRSGLTGIGIQNFIQTDASINPGNSGGALVNLRGELVGINTAIYTPSGGNVGIGFAIPSNLARSVMSQLLEHGRVRRGSLGVEVQAIDEALAEALGIEPGQGAVVTRIRPGSPAEAAGLTPGDVILSLNGRSIRQPADLRVAEGLAPVGSPLELKLLREGRERRLEVTLTESGPLRVAGLHLDRRLEGAWFAELTPQERRRGLRGVRIERVDPGSAALKAGLREGDLLLALGEVEIPDLATLARVLRRSPEPLDLIIRRGRTLLRIPL